MIATPSVVDQTIQGNAQPLVIDSIQTQNSVPQYDSLGIYDEPLQDVDSEIITQGVPARTHLNVQSSHFLKMPELSDLTPDLGLDESPKHSNEHPVV